MEAFLAALAADQHLILGLCTLLVIALLIRGRIRRRLAERTVVVDGSNVLYWKDNTPNIATVADLVRTLRRRDLIPLVIFDANVGYLVRDRYLDDADMARLIGLAPSRVLVVGKGAPADPTILEAACTRGNRVVSNDRFRDWADDFPQVETPGFLVKGRYRGGQVEVDID